MREPTQIHDIEMLVAAQGGKANRTHIVYSMAVAEQGTGERGHERRTIGRRRRRKSLFPFLIQVELAAYHDSQFVTCVARLLKHIKCIAKTI